MPRSRARRIRRWWSTSPIPEQTLCKPALVVALTGPGGVQRASSATRHRASGRLDPVSVRVAACARGRQLQREHHRDELRPAPGAARQRVARSEARQQHGPCGSTRARPRAAARFRGGRSRSSGSVGSSSARCSGAGGGVPPRAENGPPRGDATPSDASEDPGGGGDRRVCADRRRPLHWPQRGLARHRRRRARCTGSRARTRATAGRWAARSSAGKIIHTSNAAATSPTWSTQTPPSNATGAVQRRSTARTQATASWSATSPAGLR